ncbi:hypothetical protein J5N97_011973 [Dioscorea zingiberensis]|uniref:Uncharacterized protein n=1 Tax=Dioscorea zingiberensis TaxID=325984 RepID=A0A9D5HP43_9LILI|nr:hypothetical protein J5N97_011973 [Dioscorea zingiberensis]
MFSCVACFTIVRKGFVLPGVRTRRDPDNIFKLDQVDHLKGGSTLGLTDNGKGPHQGTHRWLPATARNDDKKSAIHAEIARVSQLPPNSSYAVHRMRVLNKLLYLMSIERTRTQDEELELLFAGLSL